MDKLAKIFKALADKNRIRILKLLEKKKMCVCELSFILGITQPSVSRHLKKLKSIGLIGQEKDSFWSNYYLAKSESPQRKLLQKSLRCWLNDDSVILKDRKKAAKADRKKLCCRK